MNDAQDRNPQVQRRRRWRRALILILAIAALIAGLALYRHYTGPERIRDFATAYLQRYVHGKVIVGSASFSWWNGIRLFDVAVGEIPRSTTTLAGDHQANDVFSCREVRLTYDRLAALSGALKIESLVAVEPTCTIVRDAAEGRTNLTGLLRAPSDADRGAHGPLPTVELRDARVKVVSREDRRDRVVQDLTLTVRARPSQAVPRVYEVVWQESGGRAASGHSQIDLQTGQLRNVRGGLPWMSIEAVMLAINAKYDGAGAWCSLLGLDGNVRAMDYNLTAGAGVHTARSATIELSDSRISIPISEEERPLPTKQRYLRFEQVDGTVRLTSDDIKAEFAGLFHGSPCTVSAILQGGVEKLGTLGDAAFEAKLSVSGHDLPRFDALHNPTEARFINRWGSLARFYHDYDPHGPVDLEIEATQRTGSDEQIVIRRAILTARGGDASCRYFPYRGRNLAGTIEYTPNGVSILGITGEHGGGTITINGQLDKPTSDAGKKLTVRGTTIPIDDALFEALPDRFRKIRELFDLQGAIDVQLELVQPAGIQEQPGKWQTHAKITLRDTSAAYAGLPYPVDHLTGTITIDEDRLEVIDVAGRSGEARIGVQGDVTFSKGKLAGLDLTLDGRDVPFDEVLLSALPEADRRHIRPFHPRGRFDVQTSLLLNPDEERVVPLSRMTLKNVTIRPDVLPVEVTDLSGQVHVTPNEIVLSGLTGRYKEATVSAEGTISYADGRQATAVMIRSRDLRIDETLRGALPENLRKTLTEWKIDGPIATETLVSRDPTRPGQNTTVRTVARLSGVTVSHPSLPIPLHDVRAEVTIDEAGARATDVKARYGRADVHASFDVSRTGPAEEGKITLSLTGATLDDSLRGVLPPRMASAWDDLRPTGSVDVHMSSLQFRPTSEAGPAEWTVSGYVEFDDVALEGLAEVERMSGVLAGSGALVDRLGGTSLDGDLTISTGTVFGQHLDRADGDWSYVRAADGQGLLLLDAIHGRIYDGALTGRIEVAFDDKRADYNLSTTIHQMQVESFVNADRAARSPKGERVDIRGLADAHLYLSGPVGDGRLRRGGGRVKIVDGHIYRLPLILAILHVLNLSIPDEDAFDDARAEFYIVGNRVEIKDILLQGSVLALVGSGSMMLPDRGVDLSLVNVGPTRWARVPVLTELVEAASGELVELHVTGPLSQPTVRPRPFRGISEELKRLFRKKKPKSAEPGKP